MSPPAATWWRMPEDYQESPDYSDDVYDQDLGNLHAYGDLSSQRFRSQRWVQTGAAEEDLRRFDQIRRQPREPLIVKHIQRPVSIDLNFRPRRDPNQSTRNRLYLGAVETPTQTYQLWGFDTWQEFRDHANPDDLKFARYCYEEISTELTLAYPITGQFQIRLWTIHADRPIRGFWAISIDRYPENDRNIFSVHGDRRQIHTDLSIINRTSVLYNPARWEHHDTAR